MFVTVFDARNRTLIEVNLYGITYFHEESLQIWLNNGDVIPTDQATIERLKER